MSWYPSRSPQNARITVAAENTNVVAVQIQLLDSGGVDLAVRGSVFAYLSDDANGDSIVATAPDTVAAVTDGVVVPLIAGKYFALMSEADGDIDINVTEDGTKTCYLVVVLPSGQHVVSAAIPTAA